jgi:RNA polymerase sigma-70 factor (sigma-E family)
LGVNMVSLTGAPPHVGDAPRAERREAALETVYLHHRRSLLRTAALLVDEPAQAEDIVQEAFVRAFASWHRLEDPGKALAYIRRIVVNLSRSTLRRRGVVRRHPPGPAVPFPSAEDEALRALEQHAVVVVLRSLSGRQREALVLRYFLNLSEAEMAAAMNVSAGSVKAYASRGLDELGRRVEKEA